jgi:hypothetical protein
MSTLALVVIVALAIGGLGLLTMSVSKKMATKRALNEPPQQKSPRRGQPATLAESPKHGKEKTSRPSPTAAPAPRRKVQPVVLMLGVVGVFVIGLMIAGAKSTSAVVVDGKITRNFGAASACQSASIPFTVSNGADLERQGEELLKGYEGMEGVGEVTLDIAQSKVDLAWCESSQSEESMRQVLSSSGLVTLGAGASSTASAPTTATVDPSGKTQTAEVDTSSGSFAPGQIALKAGVPAEISFGSAAGCLSEVIISDLGINQDLTKGPATVKLPALEAGTYQFACAMGHQTGQIVVQ